MNQPCMHAQLLSCVWLFETSWPGSSVYGILKLRILDWVAMPSSRGSFPLKDQTRGSWIDKQVLYDWAPWEAPE